MEVYVDLQVQVMPSTSRESVKLMGDSVQFEQRHTGY